MIMMVMMVVMVIILVMLTMRGGGKRKERKKYGYYLRMQKTAAQMQSIKRAVEETAMFSASILPTR